MDSPDVRRRACRRPHRRTCDHRRHPCGASARAGADLPGAARAHASCCACPRSSSTVFNSDETFLATQAQVIRDGGSLYEDATDRKPPLVPYLYAATFALVGTHRAVVGARRRDARGRAHRACCSRRGAAPVGRARRVDRRRSCSSSRRSRSRRKTARRRTSRCSCCRR